MSKKDRKKKKHDSSGESGGRGGGMLSSMRGGLKTMAGQGEGKKGKMSRAWDILFWVVILALLALFAYRRFR